MPVSKVAVTDRADSAVNIANRAIPSAAIDHVAGATAADADFSQPQRHHSGRGLSNDTSRTPRAADRKIGNLPFALRLLAHPTYGAQGISDDERNSIISAARFIDHVLGELDRLTERVRDLSIEADQLRGAA